MDQAVKAWRKGGELTGLMLLALSTAVCLALVSSNPADIETDGKVGNWIGPVGAYVADIMLYIFGAGSFFIVAVIFLLGGFMLIGRRPELKPSEFVGQGLLVLSGAILSHLVFKGDFLFGHQAGGLVGELLGTVSAGLIGEVGSYIFASCVAVMALMLITDMSPGGMVRWAGVQLGRLFGGALHRYQAQRELRRRWKEEREALLAAAESDEDGADWFVDDDKLQEEVEAELKRRRKRLQDEIKRKKTSSTGKEEPEAEVETPIKDRSARRAEPKEAAPPPAAEETARKAAEKATGKTPEKEPSRGGVGLLGRLLGRGKGEPEPEPEPIADEPALDGFVLGDAPGHVEAAEPAVVLGGAASPPPEDDDEAPEVVAAPVARTPLVRERKPTEPPSAPEGDDGPQIIESEAIRAAREKRERLVEDKGPMRLKKPEPGEFALPPLSFLDYENPDEVVVDKDHLRQMAVQLEETLSNFGVEGKIVEICPGPVITMFEFSPAPGVKLSKIANLSDDLAMALAAISVRIIAPIPGKGVVGIEVPNPTREMVFLKEIIADDAFQQSKARMPMALGKSTEGGPVVADLASMPHLLVAGATGAGKSVAVNTMIVSLLFRYTPNDVRLIMVDPKMLEFSVYEGIPHLLLPVVTDPKQAAVALNWAVNEMERRYQLLADMGVRNITTYNKRVEKLTADVEEDLAAGRTHSAAIEKMQLDDSGVPRHQHMPYIVVIIDEFADLMMVASKDVEQCVARLAQKARAAGLHLILATQRPSVDVITGLIKANFPTRIALRVAQKTDSRTILDSNGAENLLGKGDMLFLPPGSSQQQRVHGAFVSENEIDRVVGFLKEQGHPEYDETILTGGGEEKASAEGEDEESDEHYDEAIYIVTSERKASISMLQRKLRVGYNRAARMIERMEEDGIVGPSDGSRPREVIAPPPP